MSLTEACSMFTIVILLLGYSNAQFAVSPSPLPESHHVHTGAIYNGVLHLFSGRSGTRFDARYRDYEWRASVNPYTGDWPNNPDYFSQPLGTDRVRVDCNSVQIENLVYVINPWIAEGTGTPWNEMFIFNLLTNSYSVSTASPISGYGGCALYDNDHYIYYIGGMEYDGSQWKYPQNGQNYDPVQVYDITADSWSQKKELAPATDINDCEFHPNYQYIYRFGGEDKDGNKLDRISRYTISTNQWNTVSTAVLTEARNQHRCELLRLDNRIYCMGGKIMGDTRTTLVDIFDPITETIVGTDHMAYSRTGFHTDKYGDNCIYITGGIGYEGIASLETYDYLLSSIETLGDCGIFNEPTKHPTQIPSKNPTQIPSKNPIEIPSKNPTEIPSKNPIGIPSKNPTEIPSKNPTEIPSQVPSYDPTENPTKGPIVMNTEYPTQNPTKHIDVTTTLNTESASILSTDSATISNTESDSILSTTISNTESASILSTDSATISSTAFSTDTMIDTTMELYVMSPTKEREEVVLLKYCIDINIGFLFALGLNDSLIVLNTLYETTDTNLKNSILEDECWISESLMNAVSLNNTSVYNVKIVECESDREPESSTIQSFTNGVISDLIQTLHQYPQITVINVNIDLKMDQNPTTMTPDTTADHDIDTDTDTDTDIQTTDTAGDTITDTNDPMTFFGVKAIYLYITIPAFIVILALGVYLGIRGTVVYEEKKLNATEGDTTTAPGTTPHHKTTDTDTLRDSSYNNIVPREADAQPGGKHHRASITYTASMESMYNNNAQPLPGGKHQRNISNTTSLESMYNNIDQYTAGGTSETPMAFEISPVTRARSMSPIMEIAEKKSGNKATTGNTSDGNDEEFFGECQECGNCRPGKINEVNGGFYCLQCWNLYKSTIKVPQYYEQPVLGSVHLELIQSNDDEYVTKKDEQKEDVILEDMLCDVLKKQIIDPNAIHQMNIHNAVNQMNNDSDSDKSDDMYEK